MISLYISAAFDTINHGKLLSRFRNEFGVTDMALNWLKSYIADWHQFVKLGRHSSATVRCIPGVPQGSTPGPLIFAAYASSIGEVISSHGADHHQYADDSQLFLAMCTSTISSNLSTLEICAKAVKHWFADNDLLLNADKSEVMLVGSSP
jgi:Reverse transcriptase (RNA-dependent DNA polymerase)